MIGKEGDSDMKKIKLSKESKTQIIADIQKYFMDEREEEMGSLSAELLLQFMIEKIGPTIYNEAIRDAHFLISKKIEDLYGLEK